VSYVVWWFWGMGFCGEEVYDTPPGSTGDTLCGALIEPVWPWALVASTRRTPDPTPIRKLARLYLVLSIAGLGTGIWSAVIGDYVLVAIAVGAATFCAWQAWWLRRTADRFAKPS
jgi:integral membrane sensor domain MASE1